MAQSYRRRDQASMWDPHAEIQDGDTVYRIELSVPCVRREDLVVELREDLLIVAGHRVAGEGNRQRVYGQFYRTFSLPRRVQTDGIAAFLEGDTLAISMPKLAQREVERIPVL